MYTLVWTATFRRSAKRFFRRHLDLRSVFDDVVHRLEANPFDPSLRLHNLQGKLSGKQAVNLTYSYRIVLNVEIVGQEVILHDIGSHDEVYGG